MWDGQGQTKGRMWPRVCTMPRSEIEDNLSSIDVKCEEKQTNDNEGHVSL